jgi:hypothetical protein
VLPLIVVVEISLQFHRSYLLFVPGAGWGACGIPFEWSSEESADEDIQLRHRFCWSDMRTVWGQTSCTPQVCVFTFFGSRGPVMLLGLLCNECSALCAVGLYGCRCSCSHPC